MCVVRVCIISKMFPPVVGGSGRYAYEIANALGERGHDVDVYTQSKADAESTVEIHNTVSVYTFTKARRYLVTFETVYYSVRARVGVDLDNYGVIHGTLMPALTIALSDRFTFDTRIILTSHSFALSEVFAHSPEKTADYLFNYAFYPMNVVMDNVAARAADGIIAISEQMRNQLTSRYGIDDETVTRISHGVDTERYRPRDERHKAVSDDRSTLLFVGRLISRKGTDLATKALAATDRDDIELLVAGAGRLENDLKRLARNHGLEDRVRFLGYVPDEVLPVLYSSADATLFTLNYEGFGLVLTESLASGTPVIGAPVGGVPDVIEDGETGFVVPRDKRQFAHRITQLANDPELVADMSAAAAEAAKSMDWTDVAADVEALYRSVIEED